MIIEIPDYIDLAQIINPPSPTEKQIEINRNINAIRSF